MERIYITYEYWNPLTNQPFYVGAGLRNRAKHHLGEAKRVLNGRKTNDTNHRKIDTIINIIQNNLTPIIKIVYTGPASIAFQIEIDLISKYGRINTGTGILTNMTNGGDSGIKGVVMSEETKKRMSDSRKGEKNHFFGRIVSPEQKKHQSILMSGRYLGSNNPFFGKKHTNQSKDLISITRKNKIAAGLIIPTKHTEDHKKHMSKKMSGSNNPMSRSYNITSPQGVTISITSLKTWCENNNLSRTMFTTMLKSGTSLKGWTIVYK